MPGMLGTELARDILRFSENTDIVFLTTSSDYAGDAFSIHAADYICKPYTQEQFDTALERVIALHEKRTWILLRCGGELHRIALEDILYIETRDKRRVFALASGKKLSVWSLPTELRDPIMGQKGMTTCGKSYIVNLNHVRCFSGADLVMDIYLAAPAREFDTDAELEAYLAEYDGLKDDGYWELFRTLEKIKLANGVLSLYISYMDPESMTGVYVLDADDTENGCPAGMWDIIYPDNYEAMTHPEDGFDAYITDTEE